MSAALKAIQKQAFSERIRIQDALLDYDGLRKHKIAKVDFVRAMNALNLKCSVQDLEDIAECYDAGENKMDYYQFCADVDSVAVSAHLETTPLKAVPAPGSTLVESFTVNPAESYEEEQALENLLFKVAQKLRAMGTVLKDAYKDYDRNNDGTCTKANFLRAFPLGDVPLSEKDKLAKRYSVVAKDGRVDVNYRAMNQDVSEDPQGTAAPKVTAAPPASAPVANPDEVETVWSNDSLSVEQILQAYAYDRSLRTRDYFKDYDPLTKHTCSFDKVRAVFSILGISANLKLTTEQMDELVSKYTQEDGRFNWGALCDVLDDTSIRAFKTGDVGGGPLRNRMQVTDTENEICEQIEKRVAAKTRRENINLEFVFKDYDRSGRGRVTATQFHRALYTFNYEINAMEVGLLVQKYCDNGEKDMINWRDCLAACDAHQPDRRSEV